MRQSSATTGPVPPRDRKSEQPDITWVDRPRLTRTGQTECVREAWITAPVDDGVWTIGYRIETAGGVPHIAEQRQWPTDSPPWKPPRTNATRIAPSLVRAQRALSPQKALQVWFERNETIDAGRGVLQPVPRGHGYVPEVVQHHGHAEDGFYAGVAARYAAIRRANGDYSAILADELGVSRSLARKYVRRCRQRNLLEGDSLTAYALELRQHAA